MRALLCLVVLFFQVAPVVAGDCAKDDPRMKLLTSLVRYCMVAGDKVVQESTRLCSYDCLISTESIAQPAQSPCPLTVRQFIYRDGTRDVVSN
jgi:hypothetical protein